MNLDSLVNVITGLEGQIGVSYGNVGIFTTVILAVIFAVQFFKKRFNLDGKKVFLVSVPASLIAGFLYGMPLGFNFLESFGCSVFITIVAGGCCDFCKGILVFIAKALAGTADESKKKK